MGATRGLERAQDITHPKAALFQFLFEFDAGIVYHFVHGVAIGLETLRHHDHRHIVQGDGNQDLTLARG